MKEFWNTRYAQEGYAYGTEPSVYFKQRLEGLPLGTVLFAAEGEGRNALYTAALGYKISAFDISEEGRKKALTLAKERRLDIDYRIGQLEELAYTKQSFDALVLIYAHFLAALRRKLHQQLTNLLCPWGWLILEALGKRDPEYVAENPSVAGPKDEQMLFSEKELAADFPNFEHIELLEQETTLDEGLYHRGRASVLRLFAKKN